MNGHFTWYLARATGLTSWILVTASVAWGLVLSTRVSRTARPAWLLDLHRFLGLLSVVFVGVHLGALAADSYTHWGPADLLVPLASAWKPGPVAWGVVALYVLLAVEVTSLLFSRIPRRFWRTVHASSYGLFVLATIHGVLAGTDAANPLVEWGALLGSVGVVYLTAIRAIAGRFSPRTAPRRAASAAGAPRPAPAATGIETRAARP
ncbi:MAG: ferric reductase-like transmembrane domain-containing protein [Acidimicrobiia bacterium]